MKTNIIITLQVEGIHWWGGCNIESVSFLQYAHRHIFHIVCKKAVQHNDRDIEIISFKRDVLSYLKETYCYGADVCYFKERSCEMIAQELTEKFNLAYCSVLEDNENGAEVTNS